MYHSIARSFCDTYELSISTYSELKKKEKGILRASVLKEVINVIAKKTPKEPVFLVCCSFLQPQNALCSWQFNFCSIAHSPFYVPLATCPNAGHPKSCCLFPCIRAPEFYIIFLLKDPDFPIFETPTILNQKLYWTRTDFQWYCCTGATHQEPWFLHDGKSYGITHPREKFVLVSIRLTHYEVHEPPALLPGKKDF